MAGREVGGRAGVSTADEHVESLSQDAHTSPSSRPSTLTSSHAPPQTGLLPLGSRLFKVVGRGDGFEVTLGSVVVDGAARTDLSEPDRVKRNDVGGKRLFESVVALEDENDLCVRVSGAVSVHELDCVLDRRKRSVVAKPSFERVLTLSIS